MKNLKEKIGKMTEENINLKRSNLEKAKTINEKDKEIERLKHIIEEYDINTNKNNTRIKVNNSRDFT